MAHIINIRNGMRHILQTENTCHSDQKLFTEHIPNIRNDVQNMS